MKYPPTPPTTTPAHSLAAMGMDETAARLHVIAEGRGTKWLFERYGLAEDPFGMTPNPAYFYASRSHAEARSSLIVGIECGVGFHALIAPAGMGKTTLLLDLLQQYRDVARTAFLFQIQGNSRDFLRYLMSELKSPTMEADFVLMQQAINELFLREVHAGRRTIVVIDEAQKLDPAVLEIIRLLSNFETQSEKLVHIVLAGQPQLAERLADSKLENLRQRIAILTTLVPFDLEDTKNYITHRLKVGGHKDPGLFTPSAVKLIWEHSRGVPRNINTLCFNALLLARSLEQQQIDARILREVLTDSDWDHFSLNAYTPTSGEWSAQAAPALVEPTHEAERLSDTLGGLDVDPDAAVIKEDDHSPAYDGAAQHEHVEKAGCGDHGRLRDQREPTILESPARPSASVDELRSLLNPEIKEHRDLAQIFLRWGTRALTVAVASIVLAAAIGYKARWVPFVRIQVKQGLAKIESASASSLGLVVTDEDHPSSQNRQQGKSQISPVPVEKVFTGLVAETNDKDLSSPASKGFASAQYQLGLRYAAGAGVPQDENKAAEWFKKAANQGHPAAQRALSELYLRGQGVPKDVVRAYTWLSIATHSHDYPTPEMKSIESRMTSRQISDAEKRIAAWSKSEPTMRP